MDFIRCTNWPRNIYIQWRKKQFYSTRLKCKWSIREVVLDLNRAHCVLGTKKMQVCVWSLWSGPLLEQNSHLWQVVKRASWLWNHAWIQGFICLLLFPTPVGQWSLIPLLMPVLRIAQYKIPIQRASMISQSYILVVRKGFLFLGKETIHRHYKKSYHRGMRTFTVHQVLLKEQTELTKVPVVSSSWDLLCYNLNTELSCRHDILCSYHIVHDLNLTPKSCMMVKLKKNEIFIHVFKKTVQAVKLPFCSSHVKSQPQ